MMHRRRRSGNLRGTPGWLLRLIPDSVKGENAPVAVSTATPASTKKALKGKAEKKSKLEKQLERGTECCPVIRVKCEMRTVKFEVPAARFVKKLAPDPKDPAYFINRKVKEKYMKTAEKKVRLCSVSAGKHQGEMLPAKEARQEANVLRSLLKAENCAVRQAGDKLGKK